MKNQIHTKFAPGCPNANASKCAHIIQMCGKLFKQYLSKRRIQYMCFQMIKFAHKFALYNSKFVAFMAFAFWQWVENVLQI